MGIFTPAFFRRVITGLALFAHSMGTRAQNTPPAWQDATNIGQETFDTGVGAVDGAGNHYVIGAMRGSLTVGTTTLTSVGDVDSYLAKYSPGGAVLWVRQIGSPGADLIFDVALDAAGNSYVTGRFNGPVALGNNLSLSNASSSPEVFVVRYSPLGTPEWAQQSTSGSNSTGFGIGTDLAGNLYVTGTCNAPFTLGGVALGMPNNQYRPVFLARLSWATGAVQSLVTAFAYPALGGSFGLPRLAVGPAGETVITISFSQPAPLCPNGLTFTSRGGTDALVAKYTALGSFQWAQQIGSTGNDPISDATVDAAGNVYVCGTARGTNVVGTITLPYQGGADGYVAKYSSQGIAQWAEALGGTADDTWNSVSLDATGAPYVAGSFSTSSQVSTTTLSSTGATDAVVAAYTAQGQLRWVKQAGGPGADAAYYLGLDNASRISVRGLFANASVFGPFTLSTNAANGESYLARLGGTVSTTQTSYLPFQALYPNPAVAFVHLPGLPVGTRIQLLDAVGRVARETTVSTAAQVSVLDLAPGLYTLRATDQQGQLYTGRVAVE